LHTSIFLVLIILSGTLLNTNFEYIAPEGTAKANAVLESVKRRRKFEESLKRILPDLRDVKKVLHGKV